MTRMSKRRILSRIKRELAFSIPFSLVIGCLAIWGTKAFIFLQIVRLLIIFIFLGILLGMLSFLKRLLLKITGY